MIPARWPLTFLGLAVLGILPSAGCMRNPAQIDSPPGAGRFDALLPAPYGEKDLYPLAGDPARWMSPEDLRYERTRRVVLSVDIDGPSDCDLAISGTGIIALSELDNSKSVSLYSPDGRLLVLRHVPTDPTGVAFDPEGGLLVSSNFGPVVRIFADGSFERLSNLGATDDVTTGAGSDVFAIESGRSSIVRIRKGVLAQRISIDGYLSGMKKIFVDGGGLTFLADWSRRVVEVYERDGTLLRTILTQEQPWGVVSSGSILCYATSRGLVFHDFVQNRPLGKIETTHQCAALALGLRGEIVIADAEGDVLYVYERGAGDSGAE